MQVPRMVYAGIGVLCGLASAGVLPAQTQQTPAQQAPPAQQQAQQGQDSLAEAAAKAKAAKAASTNTSTSSDTSTSTSKKVYTNDDLRGMQRGDVSVVGGGKATGKAPASAAASNDKKNQQYWHDRAQKLRNQMAEVDRQIAQAAGATQSNGGANGTNGPNPAPPPPSTYTLGARSRAANQIQNLENRKAQIQAQIDQMEEEARRAGVPAGWLR